MIRKKANINEIVHVIGGFRPHSANKAACLILHVTNNPVQNVFLREARLLER